MPTRTRRLWWCLQSAWILRWESLALPRTPLPQDDGVGRLTSPPCIVKHRVPRLRKIVRTRTIFLRSG